MFGLFEAVAGALGDCRHGASERESALRVGGVGRRPRMFPIACYGDLNMTKSEARVRSVSGPVRSVSGPVRSVAGLAQGRRESGGTDAIPARPQRTPVSAERSDSGAGPAAGSLAVAATRAETRRANITARTTPPATKTAAIQNTDRWPG